MQKAIRSLIEAQFSLNSSPYGAIFSRVKSAHNGNCFHYYYRRCYCCLLAEMKSELSSSIIVHARLQADEE
jgi:hypothetical protein